MYLGSRYLVGVPSHRVLVATYINGVLHQLPNVSLPNEIENYLPPLSVPRCRGVRVRSVILQHVFTPAARQSPTRFERFVSGNTLVLDDVISRMQF